MPRRSSYKVTMFDRLGPDAALVVRAWSYGAVVWGVVFSVAMTLGAPVLWTLLGATTLSAFVAYGSQRIAGATGAGALYVMEGGSGTPYEESFSQEQALVMQRDYAAALALYEQRIAAMPNEPRARIAAADLYMTHGENPARAAELFREVQRIPGLAAGHDVYVANKLADLYLGPLGEPRRALVEFRRLIERYPNTVIAKNARMALDNLKGDLMRDAQGQ